MAQDGPEAPVQGLISAFDEGRFADATSYFCADLKDQALGGLGQLDALSSMDMGLDFNALLGVIDISVDGLEVSVLDQTADTASVGVKATVSAGIDEDGLVAFLAPMMSTEDAPIDEFTVRAMLPMILPEMEAQLANSVDIDETVDVVLEDGSWLLCSDLTSLASALGGVMGQQPADGTTADGTSDGMATASMAPEMTAEPVAEGE